MVAIIRLDGVTVGVAESDDQGTGALAWFHRNKPSCSMSHALEHEGYSVEEVEDIDCHDVTGILEQIAERMGVTMTAVFVPFSQSRHATIKPGADKPWRSLNWKIALSVRGTHFLDTEYAQGEGYAPASKKIWGGTGKNNIHVQRRALDIEIETGKRAGVGVGQGEPYRSAHSIAPPSLGDVLASLASDADVLDYPSFEAWATELGYDPDSRSAERTFSACMKIAMALRHAVGQPGLEELQLVARFN